MRDNSGPGDRVTPPPRGAAPDDVGAAEESRETPDRLGEPLTAVLPAKTAKALAGLSLNTVDDLLRHYPRRYAEPGELTAIAGLSRGEHVSVQAEVKSAQMIQFRNRPGVRLEAIITDGSRDLRLTFFAKHPGALRPHEGRLHAGARGIFSGTISEYRGRPQLTHPDYVLLGHDAETMADMNLQVLVPRPLYPASAAVRTWQIETAVQTVLDTLSDDDVPDPIPVAVRNQFHLPSRLAALRLVHRPTMPGHWKDGRDRLRFEEAFVLQAALAQRRIQAREQPAVARPQRDDPASLVNRFAAQLPFTLTAGQNEVAAELALDLAQPRPMLRLLQGEVGSGKTILALLAMLQVVDAGGQAALLAPTEVLAAQHARSLRELLGPLATAGELDLFAGPSDLADNDGAATRVALLTGSMSAPGKRQALADAASGAAGIVVGTHALLSEHVQFADLGLVVVDEQHRFGVEQRDVLRAKGKVTPHLLVMTATPIPRTVAMTVFGDLDTSTLSELPGGRAGITTHVVPETNAKWMARMWQRVREEIDQGYRVYVVCPRIGDGGESVITEQQWADEPVLAAEQILLDADKSPGGHARRRSANRPMRLESRLPKDNQQRAAEMASVQVVAEKLRETPALAGVDIEVLHGQLPPAEKDAVMSRFADGRCQLVVATTVVEVGLDVPEATVMVVFDADRFGLSQLHQLRGRVGRGHAPGLCLLVTGAKPGSLAARRVEELAKTSDGFELAEVDLSLRREGDVLGAAQSGRASSLRLLSVLKDEHVIKQARGPAWEVVAADPQLKHSPALADAISAHLNEDQEAYLERV